MHNKQKRQLKGILKRNLGTQLTENLIRDILEEMNKVEAITVQPVISRACAVMHLAEEYKILVKSQCLFLDYNNKPSITPPVKEITSIARYAILSKLRSIIEFYVKDIYSKTDLSASIYFKFKLSEVHNELHKKLKSVLRSIEVHSLHLTAYRDKTYREAQGKETKYIEWNDLQQEIIDGCLEALLLMAESQSNEEWKNYLQLLYKNCKDMLIENLDFNEKLIIDAEGNCKGFSLED